MRAALLPFRLAPRRYVSAVLIVLGTLLTGVKASAESVGPSFPCTPAPLDALARLTCSDRPLAQADIRMVQTYYALRRAVGPDGQKPLKSRLLSFIVNTRQTCGLPPVEPKRDQSEVPLPATAASCVAAAYDRQRAIWVRKLSGPAAEEAARAPEQNIALQGKLKALGFMPKDAAVDGVFGTGTRTALLAWQHTTGRPETGFFGDEDAAGLLGAAAVSSPQDPLAALRDKPLAQAGYHDKALAIGYKDLQVTLDTETSNNVEVCQAPNGGFLSLGSLSDSHQTTCRAVVARVAIAGKDVLTAPAALLDGKMDADTLHLKVAIRRLDAATALPQVVISGDTGGSECCALTAVATARADGTWQFVNLEQNDGGEEINFLDLAHSGSSVLVDIDDRLLNQYASFAWSYAPTRIRRLIGTTLQDVTRDPRYRSFLLRELQDMEQYYARSASQEANGYLAAWVAQKALVGQLKDGWRVMLASYDHQSTDGLSRCAVDKRVWTKSPDGKDSTCPDGQQLTVPFPEALALQLVKLGYITSEESTELGYDPAKIEAARKTTMEVATTRYEQQMTQRWFVITHAGNCVVADAPASPAELISIDREDGLEDIVNILEADDSGKPAVVQVGEPRSGDLVSVITFYRGSAKCESSRRQRRNELENLR